MTTLTGFTRNADPIDAVGMSLHISADISIPVTAEMLPDFTISVTGTITMANYAAIQASILTYVYPIPVSIYIPISAMSNSTPMDGSINEVVTSYAAKFEDTNVYNLALAYTDSKIPKTYVDGTLKTNQRLNWADSTTVVSGNATFYVTSDRTSTGTARATALDLDTVMLRTEDGTSQYAFGAVTSPNVKTVVAAILRQVFTGLTVVGIAVLGSVTNSAAPNGTVVKVTLNGDAA